MSLHDLDTGRQVEAWTEDEYFAEEEREPDCTHEELYEAMQRLTARQAFVIRLYYGLGCEPMTQREIADLVGWHRKTVYEHILLAERKLRVILCSEPRQNLYE